MSGYLGTKAVLLSTTSATVGGDSSVGGDSTIGGDLTVDTNTLYVDSANNRVGVGTASPSNPFQVGTSDLIVDSSGNLLVGKTVTTLNTTGLNVNGPDGRLEATASGNVSGIFNRTSSDGDIVSFRKDGTTVGSINARSGDLLIGTGDVGLRFDTGASSYIPFNVTTSSGRDDAIDLGASSVRFDDVYATNGTINTSDRNEKQQIAALTDAEITAAKAISKLFKTFKWNDSVTEKGDAARTHAGVIAQEVEAAMSDAGLNAGDYAFFISSDWTDEETGEERNRKGIRYPQLLSFIGAATEQRLASIEARLDALEGN